MTVVDNAEEHVANLVAEMKALASSQRFSPQVLDYVADMAYGLLRQGRHEDAYRYYSFLNFYQPTETRYLAGLGIAARELGRPAEARLLFDMAAFIDPEEPAHTLLSAECMLQEGLLDEARSTLSLTARFCDDNKEHAAVATRAKALLELTANAAAAA